MVMLNKCKKNVTNDSWPCDVLLFELWLSYIRVDNVCKKGKILSNRVFNSCTVSSNERGSFSSSAINDSSSILNTKEQFTMQRNTHTTKHTHTRNKTHTQQLKMVWLLRTIGVNEMMYCVDLYGCVYVCGGELHTKFSKFLWNYQLWSYR